MRVFTIALAVLLAGCSTPGKRTFVVAFSQANNAEPYRAAQNEMMARLFGQQPDVKLVIEVRQASGHPVFNAETRVDGEDLPGRVTFSVPRITLLGGDYDLVVGVHEPGDGDPGIDRLIGFSVAATEGGGGFVDLRGSWRVGSPLEAAR